MSTSNTPARSLGRRLVTDPEALLVISIAVILALVVLKVPDFWHVETLFNVLRASMVDIVFALGVLLVIIAGGIDVSFLAVGIFAAYLTCKIVPADATVGGASVAFLSAVAIGVLLGLINAAVVIATKVTTLIATLATSAIYMGVLFAVIGGNIINTLPVPLQDLGQVNLITAPGAARGTTRLNVLIVVVILVCLAMGAFLRWTVAGRSIIAIGGDAEAAARAAINVNRTRALVFAIAGGLAGLAGIIHVTLSGRADPTTFMGRELDVIAAVVLGGAAITGGKGTVRGTVLGVILISLIQSSLVPLGVPSIWQKAAVGALLLIGVTVQAVSARTRPARAILDDSPPERPVTASTGPATQEA
ncbi:Ribose import permease protein RbsC [Austwickia sp. TVS 96-490-7B]|uniref:ABC transporter permease n=1 Tax=Austwickia sp. TVS 96-490-7B TaxID=2830843 RepID=UPI001C57CFB6|nr:ABC transporter permease [Austwickia sp. TVS 96-490-7B]MBW3084723.1 Ribose import permease protein RbsC [Austwickia sp. TVS 96-490-7B]